MTRKWQPVVMALLLAFSVGALAQVRSVIVPFPPYPGDENLNRMEIVEDQAFFDGLNSALVIVRAPTGEKDRRGPKDGVIRIPVAFGSRIAPNLAVAVSSESSGRWLYRYAVDNGNRAYQSIDSWLLEIPEPKSPNPLDPLDIAYPVARSGAWEFGHYSPRPGVWAAQWKRTPNQPALTPGSASDFLIEADRKPGFLMASFQRGREPVMLPEGLPAKLSGRLERFLERTEGAVAVLTLGPKFRADEKLRAIAADFHVGISRLSRHGRLQADSPFVLDCLDYLQSLVDDPALEAAGLAPDFEAKPQNSLEESIYRALRLALDIRE